MPVEAAIVSIGARAASALRRHQRWTAVAQFERSLYLRHGDAFVCIGDPSIGDGPLNVIVEEGVMPAFAAGSLFEQAAAPHPNPFPLQGERRGRGNCATSCSLSLLMPDGTVLSAELASLWQPPAWPDAVHAALARERISAVLDAGRTAAPAASFIHAVRPETATGDFLTRRAAEGLRRLRRALVPQTAPDFTTAATTLLGLGHGLTPSGDDVLSGAVIMLHALGATETATALAEAIRRHMRTLTSPLSCALLDAACDGEPNAAMFQAIEAQIEGVAITDVIAPLATIGHASGFDILAGILLVVEATAN